MDLDVKPQPTDFELLEHYQNSLRAVCDTMTKYIDFPSEQEINIHLFGTPIKLVARELKEHLHMQMMFFMRKIEETQARINASEGKVG